MRDRSLFFITWLVIKRGSPIYQLILQRQSHEKMVGIFQGKARDAVFNFRNMRRDISS